MTIEQRKIIHLLNRAAFGPSPVDLEKILQLSLPEAIDYLFDTSKEFKVLQAAPIEKNSTSFKHVKPIDKKKHRKKLRMTQQRLNLKWLNEMAFSSAQRLDLSKLFYESNYHVGTLVRAILSKETFYHERKMAIRVKSPVELLVGIMRLTQLHFSNAVAAVNIQRKLGQELFAPPNVSGWVNGAIVMSIFLFKNY